MSLPARFRPAVELLKELGITEPEELDIDPVRKNYDLTRLGRDHDVQTFDTFATAAAVLAIPVSDHVAGKLVSEAFARHRNIPIGPGQTLTLVTDKGERTFPIAAVSIDYTSDQGIVWMYRGIYDAVYDDRAISTVAAFLQARIQRFLCE